MLIPSVSAQQTVLYQSISKQAIPFLVQGGHLISMLSFFVKSISPSIVSVFFTIYPVKYDYVCAIKIIMFCNLLFVVKIYIFDIYLEYPFVNEPSFHGESEVEKSNIVCHSHSARNQEI